MPIPNPEKYRTEGSLSEAERVFKNPLRSRPSVISKEAPHRTIGSHEILRAD